MLLSIVVPIYNMEQYLPKCIESVLLQSYKEFELLLIDDGSEDGSLMICKEYEKLDSRIRVIHSENRGLHFARKLGVENAKGEYITFIDSDDFIAQDAYTLAENDMKNSMDIIAFDIIRYYDDNNMKYDKSIFEERIYDKKALMDKVYPTMIWDLDRNWFGMDPSLCIKVFKAGLLKKHMEGEDTNFYYAEDVAVIYPLLWKAESLSVHHKTYYYHRQRPQNVVAPYIADKCYFQKLYEVYAYLSASMCGCEIFQRQIDIFYIHSVELAKVKYGIVPYQGEEIFPFNKVNKKDKIILYGAGHIGQLFYNQIKKLDYCNVVLWVDKNYKRLNDMIYAPEKILKEDDYDRIVIAIKEQRVKKQVEEYLIALGVSKDKII